MINQSLLGPWIKRFLLEYLISVKNLSPNTQHSYRDTLCLLIPFLSRQTKIPIDQLEVEHASDERVKRFLLDIEQKRHCSIATRNQRLAAIHSLAQFIGLHPMVWANQGNTRKENRSIHHSIFGKSRNGRFIRVIRR
jgi:integrase/recombinase XerD